MMEWVGSSLKRAHSGENFNTSNFNPRFRLPEERSLSSQSKYQTTTTKLRSRASSSQWISFHPDCSLGEKEEPIRIAKIYPSYGPLLGGLYKEFEAARRLDEHGRMECIQQEIQCGLETLFVSTLSQQRMHVASRKACVFRCTEA